MVSIVNLKNLKFHTSQKNISSFCYLHSKWKNEDNKGFKEEEPFEILKILGLIENI